MKINFSQILYLWVSAAFGCGFAGFCFLHLGGLGLLVALVVAAIMWGSLNIRVDDTQNEAHIRHKIAEGIAGVGLVVFLGLLLATHLQTALIALLVVAQLAMNVRADHNNRIYSALIIVFVCLLVGAVAAKTGHYLWFMLAFSVLAVLTLRQVYIERCIIAYSGQAPLPVTAGLNTLRHSLYLGALVGGLAVIFYLCLPRLPAGNIGAHAGGSAHFYQNAEWESQADKPLSPSTSAGSVTETQPNKKPESDPRKNTASENTAANDGYSYRGFDERFPIDNPDPYRSRFNNAVIARIKTDLPLYLKARVFDTFDGVRWSQSQIQLNKKRLERGHFEQEPSTLKSHASIARLTRDYQVHVEATLTANIPFAEELTAIDFPASVLARDAFGQWFAPEPLKAGTIYGASVQLNSFMQRPFSALTVKTQAVTAADAEGQKLLDEAERKSQQLRRQAMANYLTLPANTDARIYQLARDKTRSITGQYPELAKAVELEAFLRTEYQYDFESIFTSQNYTPLNDFLFVTKKGHCEYFASALVVMLRSLKIPARLVTGFLAHNQNPLTGYFEVRALDGHAWVEAYVDDIGWLLLEPTAYYPMPQGDTDTSAITAQKIQQYIDALKRIDEQTGHTDYSVGALLRNLWYAATLIVTVALAFTKLVIVQLWWLWLLVGVLSCLAYGIWQRYQSTLKNRYLAYRLQKTPPLTIAAQMGWLHQVLHNHKKATASGLTIEQFTACVMQSHLNAQEREQVISLFNRYAYAPTPVPEQDTATLKALLHRLLTQWVNQK